MRRTLAGIRDSSSRQGCRLVLLQPSCWGGFDSLNHGFALGFQESHSVAHLSSRIVVWRCDNKDRRCSGPPGGSSAPHRTPRVAPGSSLRAGGRGATGSLLGGGSGRPALGKLLVVLQVALSLTLLVGTGMLVRSTRALVSVDPGLARDRLLIVTVDAAPTGLEGERLAQVGRTQLERLRALPGVAAASFSENGIFTGTKSATTVQVEGFTARTAEDSTVDFDRVGPGYVEAIGARLVAGRDFT